MLKIAYHRYFVPTPTTTDDMRTALSEIYQLPADAKLTEPQQNALIKIVDDLKADWIDHIDAGIVDSAVDEDIKLKDWYLKQIRRCHGMHMEPLLRLTADPTMKRVIATLLTAATEMVADMPASLSVAKNQEAKSEEQVAD